MADPEIQMILTDPVVRQVLTDFKENPQHAQKVRMHYDHVGGCTRMCEPALVDPFSGRKLRVKKPWIEKDLRPLFRFHASPDGADSAVAL